MILKGRARRKRAEGSMDRMVSSKRGVKSKYSGVLGPKKFSPVSIGVEFDDILEEEVMLESMAAVG